MFFVIKGKFIEIPILNPSSQLTFTCSKSAIETLKRCEICSKLPIKHQDDVNDVVLVFLLLTLNIFHILYLVDIKPDVGGIWQIKIK